MTVAVPTKPLPPNDLDALRRDLAGKQRRNADLVAQCAEKQGRANALRQAMRGPQGGSLLAAEQLIGGGVDEDGDTPKATTPDRNVLRHDLDMLQAEIGALQAALPLQQRLVEEARDRVVVAVSERARPEHRSAIKRIASLIVQLSRAVAEEEKVRQGVREECGGCALRPAVPFEQIGWDLTHLSDARFYLREIHDHFGADLIPEVSEFKGRP